jgi:uncharacterized protein (UPF0332 family)
MKKPDFLSKLKKDGKLESVEPSEEICSSYLKKADDCLKSAKILLKNDLYENSVSMTYYAMYNSLTALLFKIGIKCENHSGSIIIFRRLFEKEDLYKTISFAKREDRQAVLCGFGSHKEFCTEPTQRSRNIPARD